MSLSRKKILDLIDTHAQKAHTSQYDRNVCVLAINAARETVMSIPPEIPADAFITLAQQKLLELVQNYHDTDGEYTSGKGVIGALVDDILTLAD